MRAMFVSSIVFRHIRIGKNKGSDDKKADDTSYACDVRVLLFAVHIEAFVFHSRLHASVAARID